MTIKIIKNKEYYRQFDEIIAKKIKEADRLNDLGKWLDLIYERYYKDKHSKSKICHLMTRQLLKSSLFFHKEANKRYKTIEKELFVEIWWLMNNKNDQED